jgi:hypothetical protein
MDIKVDKPVNLSALRARNNCIECDKRITAKAVRCQSCANKITSKIHGQAKTRLYIIWRGMLGRCYSKGNASYKFYGAKGITVCEEWVASFDTFKEWALVNGYSTELTLDRIDSFSKYSPDNCRWASKEVQYTNRRLMSNNSSGFRGVGKDKGKSRWYARIALNGRRIRLGLFDSAIEAAVAYNNYVIAKNLPHQLNIIP